MSAPNNRLLALDVIRGITIAGMILVNNPGSWQSVYAPLQHARWHGLTPTDLVYPFFMFIMGVAIHFSLRKFDKLNTTVSLKIIRRTVALFAVGIALDCFSKLCYGTFSWEHLRILGVMQRLALAYAGGAFLAILIPKKYYLATAGGILLLYLVLLQCFNGYVHSADNLIAVIDVKLLGAGHLIKEAAEGGSFAFEPEGLLSTIPCWAHVLFGTFVGSLITGIAENKERIRQIALFGTVLLFAGFLLQYLDPINKKLWTASYTLITSGTASLLLALLIDIIDVRQKKRWCRFFEAFGVNPLFMYVVAWIISVLFGLSFIPWGEATISVRGIIYNRTLQPLLGDYAGSLVYALFFIGVIWALGYILYRKRIYIKLEKGMFKGNVQQKPSSNLLPMLMLGTLFFIFGLVSWVNSILIPYFKVACELTHTQSYLVALAFYIAYLVMSIPAAKLIGRIGPQAGYYRRIVAYGSRDRLIRSGSLHPGLSRFPDRTIHHRYRSVYPANRSQSLCHHTGTHRVGSPAYQYHGAMQQDSRNHRPPAVCRRHPEINGYRIVRSAEE